MSTMNATTSAASWVLANRQHANRALYVMSAAVLVAAMAVPSVGLERVIAALVWLGAILLVLALPWTEWASYRTKPVEWRRRDAAAAAVRPPVL